MLASTHRFHRRNHVNRVYKEGASVRGSAISLKYRLAKNGTERRIAVVVSKKVAKNAVTRNRIRRRVFESIRNQFEMIPEGFEGVFSVFDKHVANMSHDELHESIKTLLKRATKA